MTVSSILASLGLDVAGREFSRTVRSWISHPPAVAPEPKSLRGTDKPISSSSFRALLIGINKYEHADSGNFPDLRGCVADADDMYRYLTETRGVSPNSIVTLYDQDATRARILDNIRALNDADIQRGTPILIFWAGHGSRARAAGPRWLSARFVEMLIPYDFNPNVEVKEEQGVPDYFLGHLLSELARAKGDNITVILDVCHAGSSTRRPTDIAVRGFDLETHCVLETPTVEGSPHPSRTPAYHTTPQWSSAHMTSHVLLAATSSSRPALEERGRGVFTRELLRFLREHSQPDLLTYSDVILGLPPLDPAGVQQPQCEGKNAGRYLFRTVEPSHGYRFRLRDNRIIIEAGELHGVKIDTVFDLFAHLDLEQSLLLRNVRPEHLNAEQTISRLPPNTTLATTEGWAVQTSLATSSADVGILIGIAHDSWTSTTINQAVCGFDQDRSGRIRLALVCNNNPQLLVTKGMSGQLLFDLTDEVCREAGLERLHHSIKCNTERLQEIFTAASEFFHHLSRSNAQHPLQGFVQVEAHLLEADINMAVPVGANLLENENSMRPQHVYQGGDPGPHKCYGFSIKNKHTQPLYVWIFAFNMNDLSIDEIYRPVLANGKADSCIEPNGELTIGYGNGGVVPQAFFVPPGETTAVTYLKIFASTSRPDLAHIPQDSPFSSGRGMKINRRDSGPGLLWDTLVVTMIQNLIGHGL